MWIAILRRKTKTEDWVEIPILGARKLEDLTDVLNENEFIISFLNKEHPHDFIYVVPLQ